MYCAVLNQTRIVGFRRTNASTMKAVTPLTSIGQGWPRIATEAKKGMNPTEVFTFANGMRKKNESLTIPSNANAARAFQKREGRSEEHTSELQSPCNLVCRLLLEKKKKKNNHTTRRKL